MKKNIDWQQIITQIEDNQKIFDTGFEIDDEIEIKKILKERAKSLAAEPETAIGEGILEVLEFQLANECYAFESEYIREICKLKDYTPIPSTPPYYFGIINLRGQLIPVIDLKKFFDIPAQENTGANKVIILSKDELELGILADDVKSVILLNNNELQPELPTLTDIREDYLKGITKDSLVVLNAENLLSDKNIVVNFV